VEFPLPDEISEAHGRIRYPAECVDGHHSRPAGRVANAEAAFANVGGKVRWLSCEPLLGHLTFKHLDRFNWIVIGGASRSTQTPVWRPPFEWVMDLVLQARAAGLKIYMKTNLFGEDTKTGYFGNARILELPFDAPLTADPASAADVFHLSWSQ
jgi:hypothetical protein